ncbi:MAG: lipocalin family protein [Planctomycetaceae bacterium]|nr:lipocalin family protein [Planctomycetaceae bacterium]
MTEHQQSLVFAFKSPCRTCDLTAQSHCAEAAASQGHQPGVRCSKRPCDLLRAYGTDEATERYHQTIAEWVANGRQPQKAPEEMTISELAARFWVHAEKYYRNATGRPTTEIGNMRIALRHMCDIYGNTKAMEFGPRALKTVRQRMIDNGLSRSQDGPGEGDGGDCQGRIIELTKYCKLVMDDLIQDWNWLDRLEENMKQLILLAVLITPVLGLMGCSSIPKGVTAVDGFELERYQGTWYEIARLDHVFERGLSHVTAEYTLRDDGRINVINRGYKDATGKWRSANGVARPSRDPGKGSLKVSFFRPFWADYHIIALDKTGYSYAMVTSSTRKYLWILARKPVLEDEILKDLLAQANQLGYATNELVYPKHDQSN